jgi:hypothetical protein
MYRDEEVERRKKKLQTRINIIIRLLKQGKPLLFAVFLLGKNLSIW